MQLTEVEGKKLLQEKGLRTPQGQLCTSLSHLEELLAHNTFENWSFPVFLKAQVLHGNRGLQGLVVSAISVEEIKAEAGILFSQKDQNNQPIQSILIEEGISFDRQVYVSLSYDTKTRGPILRYSTHAGEGIEERGDTLEHLPFSIEEGPASVIPDKEISPIVTQLWEVMQQNDATLVEINPLVLTKQGWFCLDAKIELEDTARFRHPEWEVYAGRSNLGRPLTEREISAHKVNELDHRGAAGESFFEFPGGEIGVLASGGGASALVMDALLSTGLKPANYTEYSGNPSKEKVKALTKVVLSIPNLKGLWVVGGNANFTDIYETLDGLMEALLASPYAQQPGFSLLIRRGGPRWQEAFAMVKERTSSTKLNVKLYGPDFPLVQTARAMKELLDNASAI